MKHFTFVAPLDAIRSMLIRTARLFLTTLTFSLLAAAAPVGICLHSDGPSVPADKIECFEFERSEPAQNGGKRFFLPKGQSVVVTDYRNRGIVLYPDKRVTNPEALASVLKTYEAIARQSPTTRPFLNPLILKIRNSQTATATQNEESSKLPSITLPDGTVLKGCKATKKDATTVSVMHTDGVRKINISALSETTKTALNLDSIPTIIEIIPKDSAVSTTSANSSDVTHATAARPKVVSSNPGIQNKTEHQKSDWPEPDEMSTAEFIATKPTNPVAFTVIAQLDNFYNFEFGQSENTHWSVRLDLEEMVTSRRTGEKVHKRFGWGYIEQGSTTGQEVFNLIKDGKPHKIIAVVSCTPIAKDGRHFRLLRFKVLKEQESTDESNE